MTHAALRLPISSSFPTKTTPCPKRFATTTFVARVPVLGPERAQALVVPEQEPVLALGQVPAAVPVVPERAQAEVREPEPAQVLAALEQGPVPEPVARALVPESAQVVRASVPELALAQVSEPEWERAQAVAGL